MDNIDHLDPYWDRPPVPVRAKINQFEAPPRPYRNIQNNITRNDRMLASTSKTHTSPTISQRAEMFKTSTVTFFRKKYNKLLENSSRQVDYPLPKAPLEAELPSHENQRDKRITMSVFKLFSNVHSTQNNDSNNSNVNNNRRNNYQEGNVEIQRSNRALNYEQYNHYPWFKENNMDLAEQLRHQLALKGKIKMGYNDDAPEYGNVNDFPSTNTYDHNQQHVQEWDSFDESDEEQNMYGNINPNENNYGNIGQEQFAHDQPPSSTDTQKNNWLHQPSPDIPHSQPSRGGPGFPHPPVSQTGSSHGSQKFQLPPFSKTTQGIPNQSRFAPPPVTSQSELFSQSQRNFQHQGFQPPPDNFEDNSNDPSQQHFKPQGFRLPPFPQSSKNNFNEYPRDNFEVSSDGPSQQNFKPQGFQLPPFPQTPNSNSNQYPRNNFEAKSSGPSQRNFKPQGFQLPKHSQSSSNQDSRSFLPPPNDSETDSFNRFQRNVKPPTSQPPGIPKFLQKNSNQDNSEINSFSQRNIIFPQPPVDVFPRNQPPQHNLNKELARKFPQHLSQSDTTVGGLPRPPRNGNFLPLPIPDSDTDPVSLSDPRSQNEFNPPPSKFNPRQPLPAPPDTNMEPPRSHVNFDTRQALPVPPDLRNEQPRSQPPVHFDPRQVLPAPTNYNNESSRSESNFKLQSTKNLNSRPPASIPSHSNNEHLHPSNKGQPRGQTDLSHVSQSYKPNPFQTVQTSRSQENDSKCWDFTTTPYFKMIGRKETENLIKNKSNGTFILRPSTRADNLCTLSIVYKSNVIHISVQTRTTGKIGLGSEKLDENTFMDVFEMVDYYKMNQMVLYTDGKDIESTRLIPFSY